MSDDGIVQGDQLASIVQRVQRLQEEKRTIEDDIKEVYQEARANGYDVKVLRAVVKHLGKDAGEVEEFDAIFDLYLAAVTGAHGARRATPAIATAVPTYPERATRPAVMPPSVKPPEAQSEASASASLGHGADALAVEVGVSLNAAQSAPFVTLTGAGEGPASPADPAPAADAPKPLAKPFDLPDIPAFLDRRPASQRA